TQRPISLLAGMLCGEGAPAGGPGASPGNDRCAIVDTGHRRELDLALELPQGELEAIASAEQMGDVLDRIAELVREHHTTLVFVNTRRLAERLAHQLGERLGADVVSAHHAALLRAVETGALDAIVPPVAPLDILAQQLVAEVAAAEAGCTIDELFALVRRAHPYRALPREAFEEVLAMVSHGITTGRGRRAA